MVMQMAHERSAAVSAAVMNDIGPDLDPSGIKRILASAGTSPVVASWDDAVTQVKKLYAHAFPDWSESEWQEHTRKTFKRSNNSGFELRVDRNVGVAARDGMSGLRHDPWELFDALLPIPLLAVRGKKSDILSAKILEKMQRRKSDLVSVVVPNCGHAPNLNEPEAINAIQAFLEFN